MEISRLLSAMMGSKELADPKQLELKVGQVVRGIVMQLFADSEALVNIAGVSVRAKLETPLQQGQPTMLQVQPQGADGQIILKPLAGSGIPIMEQSLAELVKGLGLKDTEGSRALIRELHLAGIPLNSKNAQNMQAAVQAASQQLGGAELKSVIEAAIIAYRKDLPMKGEVIAPLHQALFGKSLGTLTDNLARALHAYMQGTAGTGASAADAGSLQLAQRLVEALAKWQQLQQLPGSQAPAADGRGGPASQQAGAAPASASAAAAVANQAAAQPGAPAPNAAPPAGAIAQTAQAASPPAAAAQAASAQPPIAQAAAASMPAQSAPPADAGTAAGAAQSAAETAAGRQGGQLDGRADAAANRSAPASAATPPQGEPAAAQRAPQPPVTFGREEIWIKSIFKHLGLDYERRAVETFGQSTIDADAFESSKETIKGLILQLSADDRLPAALKDSLQQTLQQITGQQLLLGSERGTPISIMTMMIPVGQQGDGADHATVQIQARKNKNGRFDAENCRLIFDLQMNRMGNTIIDVAVVNRIVSLQVHNDHPWLGGLLEQLRPEMEQALSGIGYQFISMKHLPYPIGVPAAAEQAGGEGAHPPAAMVSAGYRNQPYKGVDMRI